MMALHNSSSRRLRQHFGGPRLQTVTLLVLAAICIAVTMLSSTTGAQTPLPRRIKAPPLLGGQWLNTKAPLRLADFRGKFVVLDFWTYCCINCKHILPVLKEIEHKYDKNVIVIGVHSPKFANEADEQNVREAIVRYDIEHPVVTDPKRSLWNAYQVDTWPSLRIIDPEGYVISVHEGEIEFPSLDRYLSRQIGIYRRRIKLDDTPVRFDLERAKAEPSPLNYPGKVLADTASNRLFIADSSNHRLVVTDLNGKLLETIGTGTPGPEDGSFATAHFRDPQGMAFRNNQLYVADTENHKIRLVDLGAKTVQTIAGVGKKREGAASSRVMPARSTPLSSPWDVHLHGDQLIIAMAGVHQIWRLDLSSGRIHVMAGNGIEDIIDGTGPPRGAYRAGTSSFAQPSGFATDGQRLFIADSEGSSIRYMPLEGGDVGTLVGTANLPRNRLFTFGDRDGAASRALFQHPICVAYYNNQVLVADTYNNKIRAINTQNGAVTTLLGNGRPGDSDDPPQLDEPAGISIGGDKLYIADTNNHAIRVYDFATRQLETLAIDGLEPPGAPRMFNGPRLQVANMGQLPAAPVRAVNGQLRVAMGVKLPPQAKLNEETPARMKIQWPADNPLAPAENKPVAARVFQGKLYAAAPLGAAQGKAKITIKLDYFYCNDGEQKFCRPAAAQWSGEVTIAPDGAMMISLQE